MLGAHTGLLGPSASSPRPCAGVLVAVCCRKQTGGAGTPRLQPARSQAVICNKAALQAVPGRVTQTFGRHFSLDLPRLWLANLLHRIRSAKRKESRLHYLKRKRIFNQEAQNLPPALKWGGAFRCLRWVGDCLAPSVRFVPYAQRLKSHRGCPQRLLCSGLGQLPGLGWR